MKPVRIIVATTAGGPYDDVARAVGPKLTEVWGQIVIVDNRPGAGNIIGATVAAKSPPDGYTFFLANVASQSINPALRKKLPVRSAKRFRAGVSDVVLADGTGGASIDAGEIGVRDGEGRNVETGRTELRLGRCRQLAASGDGVFANAGKN